jgi:Holliday junction resolvase
MAQTPEGRVKAAIKVWLKLQPNCWFYMPVSNGMGTMGIPDIVGCYMGMFFAIEVKAPGKVENTTPLQKMQIALINGSHGHAIVADSLEQVKGLFVRMRLMGARHLTLPAQTVN